MASARLVWLGLLCIMLGPTARLWCAAEVKRDHYEVLGLTRKATAADVKKAYKQLAKRYHPDKNPAADAQQKFIEIQRAFEVLSDPQKRKEYESRAGYFAGDDDSDSNRRDPFGRRQRRRGPPDGGRGKVLNTAADIMECLHSDDLWLLHVYIDSDTLFGDWMSDLPEGINLGHVNIERGDELLDTVRRMQGGRLNSMPFLLLAQNGRREAFVLNAMSMFFNPGSMVVRQALEFVDYWNKVVPLQVDAEVSDFMKFAPGGSSRLRVVFICEQLHQKYIEIFSAASKLQGYADVGQLGYHAFQNPWGQVGGFLANFNIRRLPSVILYDSLQNDHIIFGDRAVGSAANLAMQYIEGRRQVKSTKTEFFPVQELDVHMYNHLCGGDGEGKCAWVLLFATTTAFEKKTKALAKAAALFSQACQLLAGVRDRLPATFECFWLRLGVRARGWRKMFDKHRPEGSEKDGYTIAAISAQEDGTPSRLVVATSEEIKSSRTVFVWLQHAMGRYAIRRKDHIEVEWPAVPSAYDPNSEEESDNEFINWFNKWCKKLSNLARQMQTSGKDWLEQISEMFSGQYYYIQNVFRVGDFGFGTDAAIAIVETLRRMDPAILQLYAGGFCIIFIALLCLWCLGPTGTSEKTEEEALNSLELWVTVPLTRKDDERFGFGIDGDNPNGRLRVGQLTEGGLLSVWNSKVLGPERRIQEGDYLAAVTNLDTGKVALNALAMKRQLMEAKGTMLTAVLQPKLRPGLQLLASTICLDGIALANCARLGRRSDLASDDLEVIQMHPTLLEWNASRLSKGASCLSTVRLGDRIVVINGYTKVADHLNENSPLVLIARWQFVGSLVSERFEVTLKKEGQDKWGLALGVTMAVSKKWGTKEIEVRHVNPGGVAARWNASGARAVLPGDRLVAANGREGVEAISAELNASKVVFCFERWSDKKGGCSVDLEFEAPETVNRQTDAADLDNAVATAGESARADSSAEADLGGWDVDPEFDVPAAVESTADTAGSAVHSRGLADAGTSAEAQCGWDLDGDLDVAENDAKDDCGRAAAAVAEAPGTGSDAEESRLHSTEQQVKQPEDAGWDVDLEFKVSTAVDNIASVVPDTGRPGSDIALWPSIDDEGCWLQHCGVCILAALTGGSQGYTDNLSVLRAKFSEPEYPVRFFCERRLPEGYLLVALPSRSRCTLVPPEKIHLAGGLLYRVLGGEVQALDESFDPKNFAASLARWHAT